MKGLTKRQKEVVDFIKDFIEGHRFSPSYQEIRHHFGFASLGTVHKFIRVLKRKGYLTSEKHCGRSLSLQQPEVQAVAGKPDCEIPLIGHLSGDGPIETFLKSQSIAVPSGLAPNPDSCYVLKVRGNHLVHQHMADGDLLVVEATDEAEPGCMVLAMIQGHETLVRRYHPEGAYARLDSADPDESPLVVPHDDLTIQGVVVGLIRLYGL